MGTEQRPVAANPVTGERSVLLTDPREHPENVLVSHLFISPGGRVVAPHWHPSLEERFLILRGQVGFLIDGKETTLGPGGSATVARNVIHDWWQVGDEEAEAIVEVSPGLRFMEMVASLFGLARDGKVNAEGMPDPLQLAVMGHEYRDTVVFTKPPAIVRKTALPAMAALGRALGREPMYEKYMEADLYEDPDPAALAELTPDGRLRPFDGAATPGPG